MPDREPIRHWLEGLCGRAVATLELAQGLHINFSDHAIVGHTALDPKHIAFPAVFVGRSDSAIPVLSVVALDDVGMDVQRSGLYKN